MAVQPVVYRPGEAREENLVARTRVVVRTHVSEARPFGKLRAGYGAPGSGRHRGNPPFTVRL